MPKPGSKWMIHTSPATRDGSHTISLENFTCVDSKYSLLHVFINGSIFSTRQYLTKVEEGYSSLSHDYCRKRSILLFLHCSQKPGYYQHIHHMKVQLSLNGNSVERSDTINFGARGGLSGKLDFSSLLLATRGESEASSSHLSSLITQC